MDGDPQPQLVVRRFGLLHRPGLGQVLHEGGDAQPGADQIAQLEDFLLGQIVFAVEGVFRHIQQQGVGLAQGIALRLGKLIAVHILPGRFRRQAGDVGGNQPDQQAVLRIEAAVDDGFAALMLVRDGGNGSGHGIVQSGSPIPFQDNLDVFRVLIPVVLPVNMADEEPAVVLLLAHLIKQMIGADPLIVEDFHRAVGGQGVHHMNPVKGVMPGGFPQDPGVAAGQGVHQHRRIPEEDHVAALFHKAGQDLHRGAAQGEARGDHHHVVGHLAHLQRHAAAVLGGQEGFGDKVEIHQAEEQPFHQVGEIRFRLFPLGGGLLLGSPQQPEGFDGMDHAHPDAALSPGHGGVQPGIVVLDHGIFLVPGGLIEDGGGVIPFGLSLHGHPAQVGHPDGDAQSGLEVALEFVALEIVVPVGNAVDLAEHPFPAALMNAALGLLQGGKLMAVQQQVDAGELEMGIAAHGLAQRIGLGGQVLLGIDVAGQRQVVILAPVSDGFGEGFGEAVAQMVVVVIPYLGQLARLPEQLRQMIQQIIAVPGPEGIGQIVGEGKRDFLALFGIVQGLLAFELGFVGKNRRRGFGELVPQQLVVPLMGQLDKPLNRRLIQGIDIGLVVVPGGFRVQLQINVPHAVVLAVVHRFQPLIVGEIAVLQGDPVAGQTIAQGFFSRGDLGVESRLVRLIFGFEIRGETHEPLPIAQVGGDKAACRAGGPAVLVVQPGEHLLLLGLLVAGFDHFHKLIAEIGGVHTGAHVHVKSAEAHLLEHVDLIQQGLFVQLAVPGPEGRAAVFAAGILEILQSQGLLFFGIQHHPASSFMIGLFWGAIALVYAVQP